jgi:hypothetical protein
MSRFLPVVVRSVLAAVTALTVASVPLLPPEHLHRAGIEGRAEPLVHAHAWEIAGSSPGSTGTTLASSHGNHGLAIFLSADYTTVSRFIPHPIALLGTITVRPLAFEFLGTVLVESAASIHGPPRDAWLSRGPPSRS